MRRIATFVWSIGALLLGCSGTSGAPSTTSTNGGSSAHGGSGGSSVPVCHAGETMPCDCPAGGAGEATCDASGGGYGTCAGCDVAWSMRFDGAWSPAVRDDDNVHLTVVGGDAGATGGRAIRIAPSGDIVDDRPNDLLLWPALTSGGAAIFAGTTEEDGAFGATSLGVTAPSFAVARLDASGDVGAAQAFSFEGLGIGTWSSAGPPSPGSGRGDDGRVVFVTPFYGPNYGASERAVLALSAKGEVLWLQTISGYWSLGEHGGAAVTPGGEVIVGASVGGAVSYGSGGATPPSYMDGYVARYGLSGELLFHREFSVAGDTHVDHVAIATDPEGHTLVEVSATGLIDLGDGPVGTPGEWGAWLAKLTSGGDVIWRQPIDAFGPMATAPNGDIWICGLLATGLSVGGQPAAVAGTSDLLITRHHSSGAALSHRQIGGPGADACDFIAVGASGIPVITGTFQTSIDFGAGPLIAPHGTDMFAARLGP